MSRKQIRETARFWATDETGNQYQIIELTEFFDASSPGNPDEWKPGLKSYRLENGTAVNRDDDEFVIFDSGVRLHRIS